MKKILSVAAAAALLALFAACNKNNDNDTRFEGPRFIQYAGQLIPRDGVPAALTSTAATKADAAPAAIPQSIELTESGLYAIGQLTDDGLAYRMGDYTVDGNVYTLNGYGTVEFDNAAPGAVTMHLTPAGGATQDVPADFIKAAGTNQLYRGWTVDKTRVTVQGWTTASADFAGCDFNEIANFLKKNGHKVPDDIRPGQSLRSISFTGTEKMLFYYSDGSADVSAYRFNGKSFTYRWDNDKMGFTFLTDQATVEYMDGKCILTIRASIQDSTTSGSVTFVLSPMD